MDGWFGVNNNSVSDDAPLASLKVEMVIRARALIAVAQNAG